MFQPARLKFLFADGTDDVFDLGRFLARVVPLARRELAGIEALAQRIREPALRGLALSSVRAKAYHVAGACILATFLPRAARGHYVEIVAPLESIYDFLDSLCDRHPDTPYEAIRQLHESLADALNPDRPMGDYYRFGPSGDDGGYLQTLVRRTRRGLARLAEYPRLMPCFMEAASLYADHQALKHLPRGERLPALHAWHAREAAKFGDLTWFEAAAAAGSQFQIYAPLYAVFCSDFEEIGPAYDAYFPQFCALHVLLDAFIDRDEDRQHGELNWVGSYESIGGFTQRAASMAGSARRNFRELAFPRAHTFALRIMALFYLTHPKVFAQGLNQEAIGVLEALE